VQEKKKIKILRRRKVSSSTDKEREMGSEFGGAQSIQGDIATG
jgi:hypothetical protein